jgi:hypothetical protein
MAVNTSVRADLYLQEAFNYAPGTLGINAPWTGASDLVTVAGPTLTYPGVAVLTPPGAAASIAQGGLSAVVTYRSFDRVATSGSVYFSFLISFSNVNANVYFAGLLPPTVGLPNGSASDPCDITVKAAGAGYNLGIRAKGSGISATNAPALLLLNTVYLVVAKYDFGSGAASLYLNPNPTWLEPASPDAVSVGTAKVSSLDHLFLRVSGPTAGICGVDTLRVGSSWGDVMPLGQISPATRLVFTSAPRVGEPNVVLSNAVVQVRNEDGYNLPSNGVPVTLSLGGGAFSSGTISVLTDTNGRASFGDLAVGVPGAYTATATASGIGGGLAPATSEPLMIGSIAVTPAGAALATFLDSLQVERFWANGYSVNWLTGARGGTGPNMTKGTASHCSAFAAGAAELLGVYLLRPPDQSDLGLANNQADWLRLNPGGWCAVPSATNAQHLANAGMLVMASYKDPDTSGHIAVLRASAKPDADLPAVGPQECQSGITNYNDTNVKTGFNQHAGAFPNGIRYYAHALTNPILPANPVLGLCSYSNLVFCLNATSVVGRAYKLQWMVDAGGWADVLTFTNSNDPTNFFCAPALSDVSASNAPRRFYRLLAQ